MQPNYLTNSAVEAVLAGNSTPNPNQNAKSAKNKRHFLIVTLVFLGILVGGLLRQATTNQSGAAEPYSLAPIISADPDWVEPLWMEQARQELARYQGEMMDCLAEYGVVGVPRIGSDRVLVDAMPTDSEGNLDREAMRVNDAARQNCNDRVARPAHMPQAPAFASVRTPETYERMLDVRECLIAHGWDVREAPAFEAWALSPMPWNPWANQISWLQIEDLFANTPDREEFVRLVDQLEGELRVACPQDGASVLFS